MSDQNGSPRVGILMGSASDWPVVQHASAMLKRFDITHEARVLSAHRTPKQACEYAETAEARGIKVLICAAGGAAHLAGVIAAHTHLPVLGVPMKGWAVEGMDALLSTVQMPAGIPVASLAIGKAGAKNAALFAVSILALEDSAMRERYLAFRREQSDSVLATELPPAEG
ncbi:MAG: 5-(carboxyamino)imidazole ribonucleotide mutase [Myxococcales bacterium FL481]|nr:MAG: 5-(carboxyamino)imidazole ribonucleotide mutase [Myxococcales bacterium FL481]